ncbi:unnamed protein product [Soboliphyme baturini]|uniref:Cyclic nucleotide-binding domain-containing protein n=1 Tax=Soboliphyme baturini TaxID=241478 RepID=A0A183IZR1_9BILA|nr:unnamed protein product [Soboliphyme baturini]
MKRLDLSQQSTWRRFARTAKCFIGTPVEEDIFRVTVTRGSCVFLNGGTIFGGEQGILCRFALISELLTHHRTERLTEAPLDPSKL